MLSPISLILMSTWSFSPPALAVSLLLLAPLWLGFSSAAKAMPTVGTFAFNTNIVATTVTKTGVATPLPAGLNIHAVTVSNTNGANCNVGVVVGDPQLSGLRGQSYKVHGIDGTIYNLVSSAHTQVNAQFVLLSQGKCPVVDGLKARNCWSHAGSYLVAVSVQQILDDGSMQQLMMTTGTADQGFESLELNGKSFKIGDSFMKDVFSVSYESTHSISVKTEQFSFILDNSDMFINQMVSATGSTPTACSAKPRLPRRTRLLFVTLLAMSMTTLCRRMTYSAVALLTISPLLLLKRFLFISLGSYSTVTGTSGLLQNIGRSSIFGFAFYSHYFPIICCSRNFRLAYVERFTNNFFVFLY